MPVTTAGAVYLPSSLHQTASTLLYYTFIVLTALYFAGPSIAPSLNIPQLTRAVDYVRDKSMYTIAAIMLCNVLSSQLMSTGAFEVYINNELMFSKLQSGIIPSSERLSQLVLEYAEAHHAMK